MSMLYLKEVALKTGDFRSEDKEESRIFKYWKEIFSSRGQEGEVWEEDFLKLISLWRKFKEVKVVRRIQTQES